MSRSKCLEYADGADVDPHHEDPHWLRAIGSDLQRSDCVRIPASLEPAHRPSGCTGLETSLSAANGRDPTLKPYQLSATLFGQEGPSHLTSMESILIGSARIIRNFYPRLAPRGVVINIEIGSFIESVVERFRRGRSEVVMDIRIAGVGLGT